MRCCRSAVWKVCRNSSDRWFFHALNSRAVVRRYLKDHGYIQNDITAIVAHIGGGITVTLHRNGKVIDSNNGVGGDGPFTPEIVGSCLVSNWLTSATAVNIPKRR